MVEVNCETDFVARNDDFKAFAQEIAQIVARDNPADVEALGARKLASGDTVEDRRVSLVQKIGENMSIRRFVRTGARGTLASYVHGVEIGVLVDVTGDAAVGKDVAMHVAAGAAPGAIKPIGVSRNDVPAELIEGRAIYTAQAPKPASPRTSSPRWSRAASTSTSRGHVAGPAVRQESGRTVEKYLRARGTVNGFTRSSSQGIEKRRMTCGRSCGHGQSLKGRLQ